MGEAILIVPGGFGRLLFIIDIQSVILTGATLTGASRTSLPMAPDVNWSIVLGRKLR
jgi:hypothetical protein